ncbi:hypothetical protein PENTCL1PPCAC_26971, partial [Pristionchus entomophagus]
SIILSFPLPIPLRFAPVENHSSESQLVLSTFRTSSIVEIMTELIGNVHLLSPKIEEVRFESIFEIGEKDLRQDCNPSHHRLILQIIIVDERIDEFP